MSRPEATPTLRRTLNRGVAAAGGLALTIAGSLFLFQLFSSNYAAFRKQSRTALETSAALAERARTFDQDQVLASMSPRPFNGVHYRFEDELPASDPNVPAGEEAGDNSPSPASHRRFGQDIRELELRPTEAGLAPVDSEAGHGPVEWEIPLAVLGEIQFRLRTSEAERVRLIFSPARESADSADTPTPEVEYAISPITDGKEHLYRVPPKVIRRWNDRLDVLRSVRIVGEDSESARSVEGLRFISSTAAYAGGPFGRDRMNLDGETRSGFFLWTPHAIPFRVTVPPDEAWLEFGYGALPQDAPLEFRVTLQHEDSDQLLFSKQLDPGEFGDWREAQLDLGAWAAKEVTLTFEVRGREGLLAFWSAPRLVTMRTRPLNIVLILEDTLRADGISAYGNPRETTPVKDRWAEEAVLFRRAVSAGTHTRISCPSLMTGLQPTATGVWNRNHSLSPNYLTLPRILRNQGFATAAFIQNPEGGRLAGLTDGYSAYFDEKASGDRAEQAYDLAMNWIEDHRDRNFFTYIHVTDPHFPYKPEEAFNHWSNTPVREAFATFAERRRELSPKPAFSRNVQMRVDWSESMPDELTRALYDGEISMNDHHFGRFLNGLKSLGLYDSTMIAFLSDHGEYFGEHGLFGHYPPTCGKVVHIPLMISFPEAFPGGHAVDTRVHLVDVMPTILDLADIQTDSLLLQGRSLRPELEEGDQGGPPRLIVVDDTYEMDAHRRDRWTGGFDPPSHWGSVLFDEIHAVAGRLFEPVAPTALQSRLPDSSWMRVSSKPARGTRPATTIPRLAGISSLNTVGMLFCATIRRPISESGGPCGIRKALPSPMTRRPSSI